MFMDIQLALVILVVIDGGDEQMTNTLQAKQSNWKNQQLFCCFHKFSTLIGLLIYKGAQTRMCVCVFVCPRVYADIFVGVCLLLERHVKDSRRCGEI